MRKNKGFSLVELILVMGIAAVLATVTTTNYFSYRNRATIDKEGSRMVEYLREGIARGRSQQNNVSWAIHIENGVSDYYELLSGGATGTPVSTVYLGDGVTFTATTSDSTSVITGGSTITPIDTQIDVGLVTTDQIYTETITVKTNGQVTRVKNY